MIKYYDFKSALKAVKENPVEIIYVDQSIENYLDVVDEAFLRDNYVFKKLSLIMQKKPEIFKLALSYGFCDSLYLYETHNLEALMHLFNLSHFALTICSAKIKSDTLFMEKLVLQNPSLINYSEVLYNNIDIVMAMVKANGENLNQIRNKLIPGKEKEICMEAIRSNKKAIRFVPQELLKDPDIMDLYNSLSEKKEIIFETFLELPEYLNIISSLKAADEDYRVFIVDLVKKYNLLPKEKKEELEKNFSLDGFSSFKEYIDYLSCYAFISALYSEEDTTDIINKLYLLYEPFIISRCFWEIENSRKGNGR